MKMNLGIKKRVENPHFRHVWHVLGNYIGYLALVFLVFLISYIIAYLQVILFIH